MNLEKLKSLSETIDLAYCNCIKKVISTSMQFRYGENAFNEFIKIDKVGFESVNEKRKSEGKAPIKSIILSQKSFNDFNMQDCTKALLFLDDVKGAVFEHYNLKSKFESDSYLKEYNSNLIDILEYYNKKHSAKLINENDFTNGFFATRLIIQELFSDVSDDNDSQQKTYCSIINSKILEYYQNPEVVYNPETPEKNINIAENNLQKDYTESYSADTELPKTEPDPVQQTQNTQPTQNSNQTAKNNKNFNKFLMIIIILLVIILAFVTGKSVGIKEANKKASNPSYSTNIPTENKETQPSNTTTSKPTTERTPITYIEGSAQYDTLELIIDRQEFENISDEIIVTLRNNDPKYSYALNNFFADKSMAYFNDSKFSNINDNSSEIIGPGSEIEITITPKNIKSIADIKYIKITNVTKYREAPYDFTAKDITINVNFTKK